MPQENLFLLKERIALDPGLSPKQRLGLAVAATSFRGEVSTLLREGGAINSKGEIIDYEELNNLPNSFRDFLRFWKVVTAKQSTWMGRFGLRDFIENAQVIGDVTFVAPSAAISLFSISRYEAEISDEIRTTNPENSVGQVYLTGDIAISSERPLGQDIGFVREIIRNFAVTHPSPLVQALFARLKGKYVENGLTAQTRFKNEIIYAIMADLVPQGSFRDGSSQVFLPEGIDASQLIGLAAADPLLYKEYRLNHAKTSTNPQLNQLLEELNQKRFASSLAGKGWENADYLVQIAEILSGVKDAAGQD